MNRKDLHTIARNLKASIEGVSAMLARVHSPKGVSSDEYNGAYSASQVATHEARYIAQYIIGRTDERAAFLRACGLDAEARKAQMNLPREMALA